MDKNKNDLDNMKNEDQERKGKKKTLFKVQTCYQLENNKKQ